MQQDDLASRLITHSNRTSFFGNRLVNHTYQSHPNDDAVVLYSVVLAVIVAPATVQALLNNKEKITFCLKTKIKEEIIQFT